VKNGRFSSFFHVNKSQKKPCYSPACFYNEDMMLAEETDTLTTENAATETIGRYEIKSVAGQGGMATVYVAYDPLFGREVAIKLLPADLIYHPTLRQRFEREAKIVAALDHPYLVPVYDIGEENDAPYLVMRYMRGGSLSERLDKGTLSVDETVQIMMRLADGLNAVHEKQIIHRDLKPSNILFDQWGSPFISDFGTARPTHEEAVLTSLGSAVGTPAYMSPEQIQGQSDLDGRSDIYALGILLYEMLTGEHPYETDSPMGAIVQHITEPPPRLLEKNPHLPPEFEVIILQAMAKERDDRYPTAMAMAAAVEAARANGGHKKRKTAVTTAIQRILLFPTKITANTSTDSEPVTEKSSKRTGWGIAGGAIVVAILAFFMFGGNLFVAGGLAATATATPTAVLQTAVSQVAIQPTIAVQTAVSIPSTATPLPTIASSPTPSPTLIPTATEPVDDAMRAIEPSSLFAEPAVDSDEITIVAVGDEVLPLARTADGRWLFVQTDTLAQGYIFVTRVEWIGEISDLPLMLPSAAPSPAPTGCAGGCPLLELDAYPLVNGRCDDGLYYVTIYIEGRGGDGAYSYFWDDDQVAGVMAEGFGFELLVPEGELVFGTASVQSGDGQVEKRPLQIDGDSCP